MEADRKAGAMVRVTRYLSVTWLKVSVVIDDFHRPLKQTGITRRRKGFTLEKGPG